MKKRWISLCVLVLALVCVLALPTTAQAATCGDYTYTVENGKATITGYEGDGGDITIPSKLDGYPVTAIGEEAFSCCDSLTGVIIPDSVTTIGKFAFSDSYGITSITIGSGVKTIGWAALGGRVVRVSAKNPYFSSDSKGVLFNKNKTNLILAPENISSSYKIPGSVTTIGEDAFYDCKSLTAITIGGRVTTIGDGAFMFCESLTDVSISNSVKTVGEDAFAYCENLTTISVGSGVKKIGEDAFGGSAVQVDAKNRYFSSDSQGVLFNKKKTTLIQAPDNVSENYIVPNGVTTIGEGAFAGIEGLCAVALPASVTTIGEKALCHDYIVIQVYFAGTKKQWNKIAIGEGNYDIEVHFAKTATIKTQPENVVVAKNKTAKVTVKATGDGLKYQWYYAAKGSSKFKKLSGATKATYSVKMSSKVNGRKVYCVVTDKYGFTVETETVTLHMGTPVKIKTQPKSVTVAKNKTAKVTVKATGDGLKYQWYYAAKGSSKFKKLSGATKATYSVKMSSKVNGRRVYCVVTDKFNNVVQSKTATLKMK